MPQVNKIDSNTTGLRYAEEASPKTLPGSPVWKPLEPNSYSDFGGEIATVARNPINDSRQRKKGVVTDLDASGGFNSDVTQSNLDDLLQGFFFADKRVKAEEAVTGVDTDTTNPDEYEVADTEGFLVGHLIKGFNFTNPENNAVNKVAAVTADTSVEVTDGQLVDEGSLPADAIIKVVGFEADAGDFTIDVSGDLPKLVTSAHDFEDFGLVVGEWIYIGGDAATERFFESENNGFKRIASISSTELAFDKSISTMVEDDGTIDNNGGAGQDIQIFFGDALKNETGSDIVRRSYQLERTLGAPDSAEPTEIQAEYLTGSIPNEMTINIGTADKITADLSFVSMDHEQVTGAIGVKTGSRPALEESDAFNTSSDFSRIKLATVSLTNEVPDPLFAFVTDLDLGINNNVSPNKAVGVLGAFDATAGTFTVSGSMTAYFSNVAAVQAVRNNSNITLDMIIVKDGKGIIIDLPMLTLGGGRVNVEQDQPITLPLSYDAASAANSNENMDHTLLMNFFDYLPDAANP